MCIWIINYQPGEIVYQPLIQLFGFDNIYHETILVNNKHQWPINQGLFKIYIQLESGENRIELSTSTSQLSFALIYQPSKTCIRSFRLIYTSLSDQIDSHIQHVCKQFLFLTKLVRLTFDEILYKQTKYQRSLLFEIEKSIHHISMLKDDFQEKLTDNDIFKEIYRKIQATDLSQDPNVKLIVNSSISSTITFASTFKNVVVLNLPKQFSSLPSSFDEFYECLQTDKSESLFYSIGAYLHELGHLFGLDHGNTQTETIMSSSKGYIGSGRDFFLISSHLCSIVFNRQCLCYQQPILNLSYSYSHGLQHKQSTHLKMTCKSDSHCLCSLKFHSRQDDDRPVQCECNEQFQFEIEHCRQLINQFSDKSAQ